MLDIITARTRKDNANKVKNDVRAKFVVHCDSKEVEAIFLYVRLSSPLYQLRLNYRSLRRVECRPECSTEHVAMLNDEKSNRR